MGRMVTLFTGQHADLPLADLALKAAGWGYDSLELACWGDHVDVVKAAGKEGQAYCSDKLGLMTSAGLVGPYAISDHLAGQNVGDKIDVRHLQWADDRVVRAYIKWRKKHSPPADDPYYVPVSIANAARAWGVNQMKCAAVAAGRIGAKVVCGFIGSRTWHLIYQFPPFVKKLGGEELGGVVEFPDPIERGLETLQEAWWPILDAMQENGVKFALEVHPTEAAFDLYTAEALLKVFDHPAFGLNFDGSHLHWQGVDPVEFIYAFGDRIFHVHMKDAWTTLGGKQGIIGSNLAFGDRRRGWDFRSMGRGHLDYQAIMAALNDVGYAGPLSAEWEDMRMDREQGCPEACHVIRGLDFAPAGGAFDAAFAKA